MEQKSCVLGDDAAAALLAVEGLQLTSAYRDRIDSLRGKGFSVDQIREALIADLQARKAA